MKTIGSDPSSAFVVSNDNVAPGLTKREYFALHLMAAYAGADYVANSGYPAEDMAKRGVEMADALIETLNK